MERFDAWRSQTMNRCRLCQGTGTLQLSPTRVRDCPECGGTGVHDIEFRVTRILTRPPLSVARRLPKAVDS